MDNIPSYKPQRLVLDKCVCFTLLLIGILISLFIFIAALGFKISYPILTFTNSKTFTNSQEESSQKQAAALYADSR